MKKNTELLNKISRIESAENMEELKEAIVDIVSEVPQEVPQDIEKRLSDIENRLNIATVDISI